MNNLYLVGFMGTGKTTVGKLVGQLLNKKFVDMDELIIESEGCSISDIFSHKGEPYFRDIETQVLKSIAGQQSLVVSTGGGCVEREKNRELIM